MAIHKGPWEPADTTKGVWLHADRDEFGHYTYTLGVEGEVYEITETAYEHLSRVWVDSRTQEAKQEQQRIIKLLEAKEQQAIQAGAGKPMPERMEYLAVEISIT